MSPEKFKQIYEDHYIKMMKYAITMVHDLDTAHYLVLDVFVSAYKNMKNVPEYKTWLMTSTKNKCIDVLRRRKVRRYYEYDDEIHFMSEPFKLNFILSETLRSIEEEIEKLPPQAKRIFRLHIAGVDIRKTASMLSISPQTVLNQRNIAMRKLKKIAHKYC